jgi:hypothetical protein
MQGLSAHAESSRNPASDSPFTCKDRIQDLKATYFQ